MTTLIGYCDGSCQPNPGAMGLGGFLAKPGGDWVAAFSMEAGQGTVNQAEYGALRELVELARAVAAEDLTIRMDSQLLVNQVNGHWRVKDPELRELYRAVTMLIEEIPDVRVEWIRRQGNQQADNLAKVPVEGGETPFPEGVIRYARLDSGLFLVRGTDNRDQLVDLEEGTCTCPESLGCPHKMMVRNAVA